MRVGQRVNLLVMLLKLISMFLEYVNGDDAVVRIGETIIVGIPVESKRTSISSSVSFDKKNKRYFA